MTTRDAPSPLRSLLFALALVIQAFLPTSAHSSAPRLALAPNSSPLYLRPGQQAVIRLDVSALPEPVNGCQAMIGFDSTHWLAPTSAGTVTPGGGPWDLVIWDSWSDDTGAPGEIDTAIGVDAQGTVGTSADGTIAFITLTASSTEGVTTVVFRPDANPDPGLVESTFLSNLAAEPVWPDTVDSPPIIIDGTPPTIATIAAIEDGISRLDGANPAVPGEVILSVDCDDSLAGLAGPPSMTLIHQDGSVPLTTADTHSPYTFSWIVTTSTPEGRWTIAVSDQDRAGNEATEDLHYIDVGQGASASGTIEFQTLRVGASAAYSIDRTVVLTATDASGAVLASWTPLIHFTNDTAVGIARGSYSIDSFPETAAYLSAKTAWSLRRRIPVTPGPQGLITADFSGATALLGGDLTNDNVVSIPDYNLLRLNWFKPNAAADINGDGAVSTPDYNLQRYSWFKAGDPQ